MSPNASTESERRAITEQHIEALQRAGCQMDAKAINTIFQVQRATAINADRHGLGTRITRLLDEHWPDSRVNGHHLADLLRGLDG